MLEFAQIPALTKIWNRDDWVKEFLACKELPDYRDIAYSTYYLTTDAETRSGKLYYSKVALEKGGYEYVPASHTLLTVDDDIGPGKKDEFGYYRVAAGLVNKYSVTEDLTFQSSVNYYYFNTTSNSYTRMTQQATTVKLTTDYQYHLGDKITGNDGKKFPVYELKYPETTDETFKSGKTYYRKNGRSYATLTEVDDTTPVTSVFQYHVGDKIAGGDGKPFTVYDQQYGDVTLNSNYQYYKKVVSGSGDTRTWRFEACTPTASSFTEAGLGSLGGALYYVTKTAKGNLYTDQYLYTVDTNKGSLSLITTIKSGNKVSTYAMKQTSDVKFSGSKTYYWKIPAYDTFESGYAVYNVPEDEVGDYISSDLELYEMENEVYIQTEGFAGRNTTTGEWYDRAGTNFPYYDFVAVATESRDGQQRGGLYRCVEQEYIKTEDETHGYTGDAINKVSKTYYEYHSDTESYVPVGGSDGRMYRSTNSSTYFELSTDTVFSSTKTYYKDNSGAISSKLVCGVLTAITEDNQVYSSSKTYYKLDSNGYYKKMIVDEDYIVNSKIDKTAGVHVLEADTSLSGSSDPDYAPNTYLAECTATVYDSNRIFYWRKSGWTFNQIASASRFGLTSAEMWDTTKTYYYHVGNGNDFKTIATDEIFTCVTDKFFGYYLTTDTKYLNGKEYWRYNSDTQRVVLMTAGVDYTVGDDIPADYVYVEYSTQPTYYKMSSPNNDSWLDKFSEMELGFNPMTVAEGTTIDHSDRYLTRSCTYTASTDTSCSSAKTYFQRGGSGTTENPYYYYKVTSQTGSPYALGYFEQSDWVYTDLDLTSSPSATTWPILTRDDNFTRTTDRTYSDETTYYYKRNDGSYSLLPSVLEDYSCMPTKDTKFVSGNEYYYYDGADLYDITEKPDDPVEGNYYFIAGNDITTIYYGTTPMTVEDAESILTLIDAYADGEIAKYGFYVQNVFQYTASYKGLLINAQSTTPYFKNAEGKVPTECSVCVPFVEGDDGYEIPNELTLYTESIPGEAILDNEYYEKCVGQYVWKQYFLDRGINVTPITNIESLFTDDTVYFRWTDPKFMIDLEDTTKSPSAWIKTTLTMEYNSKVYIFLVETSMNTYSDQFFSLQVGKSIGQFVNSVGETDYFQGESVTLTYDMLLHGVFTLTATGQSNITTSESFKASKIVFRKTTPNAVNITASRALPGMRYYSATTDEEITSIHPYVTDVSGYRMKFQDDLPLYKQNDSGSGGTSVLEPVLIENTPSSTSSIRVGQFIDTSSTATTTYLTLCKNVDNGETTPLSGSDLMKVSPEVTWGELIQSGTIEKLMSVGDSITVPMYWLQPTYNDDGTQLTITPKGEMDAQLVDYNSAVRCREVEIGYINVETHIVSESPIPQYYMRSYKTDIECMFKTDSSTETTTQRYEYVPVNITAGMQVVAGTHFLKRSDGIPHYQFYMQVWNSESSASATDTTGKKIYLAKIEYTDSYRDPLYGRTWKEVLKDSTTPIYIKHRGTSPDTSETAGQIYYIKYDIGSENATFKLGQQAHYTGEERPFKLTAGTDYTVNTSVGTLTSGNVAAKFILTKQSDGTFISTSDTKYKSGTVYYWYTDDAGFKHEYASSGTTYVRLISGVDYTVGNTIGSSSLSIYVKDSSGSYVSAVTTDTFQDKTDYYTPKTSSADWETSSLRSDLNSRTEYLYVDERGSITDEQALDIDYFRDNSVVTVLNPSVRQKISLKEVKTWSVTSDTTYQNYVKVDSNVYLYGISNTDRAQYYHDGKLMVEDPGTSVTHSTTEEYFSVNNTIGTIYTYNASNTRTTTVVPAADIKKYKTYYSRSGDGTEANPYVYTKMVEGTDYHVGGDIPDDDSVYDYSTSREAVIDAIGRKLIEDRFWIASASQLGATSMLDPQGRKFSIPIPSEGGTFDAYASSKSWCDSAIRWTRTMPDLNAETYCALSGESGVLQSGVTTYKHYVDVYVTLA